MQLPGSERSHSLLPVHWTVADGLARLPGPAGERFATLFRHGTLSIELYAPRGQDPQAPHAQDELYVVVTGHGTFRCAGRQVGFGPGDLLFAPAGAEHRFEGFSEDLVVWVVFYGPPGGERP